jgi:hypothetical protein
MEPVLLGLLCAERVITEERTRKRTIVGTFTNFRARSFPAVFPPWFVYISFTNVEGSHTLTLNIANRDTDLTVYSASASISSRDKTGQAELSIPVPNARFPEPGKYEVYVSIDGRPLGARTLRVDRAEQSTQAGDGNGRGGNGRGGTSGDGPGEGHGGLPGEGPAGGTGGAGDGPADRD